MISYLLKQFKGKLILYLMLLPFVVIFAVFTVFPVFRSIFFSFTNYNIFQDYQFVGVQNYLRLFLEDDLFLIAIRNTLIFAVITGPISYLLCLILAWFINDLSRGLRTLLTFVYYVPSLSGGVVTIWLIILSPDRYGLMNSFLLTMGFIQEPIKWFRNPDYILPSIIIVVLWMSLGTSFLAFIAGLQGIDTSLYEAGTVDGIKNRWQELWYITLPEMKPQLMFGAVMQITAAFSVGDICTTLAGFPSVDYAAHTIVTHMMDYGMIRFEFGYASAIATILFLVMVFSNKLVHRILARVGEF